jgi:indolepyruvate ferredoxin oxidoreductase alpha subunit
VALGLVASGDKPKVRIDPGICNGCGICSQQCKFDAISHRLAGGTDGNI